MFKRGFNCLIVRLILVAFVEILFLLVFIDDVLPAILEALVLILFLFVVILPAFILILALLVLTNDLSLKIHDRSYLALVEPTYNEKAYKELYLVNEGVLKGIACTSDNLHLNNLLDDLQKTIKKRLNPLSLDAVDIKLLNSIF